MTDTVLDLSAKSGPDAGLSRRKSLSDDASPASPRTPPRRSSSSDDGNESDSSLPPSAIKPVAGPIPTHRFSESPGSRSDNPDRGEASSPTSSTLAGLIRPFKSYSMEGMFPSQTSPLLAGHSGGLPTTMSMGLGLSSLVDSSAFPSFPITPLTSHLLQRKRRAESRSTTSSGENSPSSDSKKLKLLDEDKKDDSYWERRRKNNEAAKRSRDNRRQKEEEIAMRAAFLEQENLKLRAQVAILKNETAKLHYMLYNRL